jgi:hypothetical protein
MNAKQVDVVCPCCASVLTVDVLTGKVLRSLRANELEQGRPSEERWDAAQQRVRHRTSAGADKLEDALEHERGKEARFDDLFKKAQDKHSKKERDE